jgi:hypothetical protein
MRPQNGPSPRIVRAPIDRLVQELGGLDLEDTVRRSRDLLGRRQAAIQQARIASQFEQKGAISRFQLALRGALSGTAAGN